METQNDSGLTNWKDSKFLLGIEVTLISIFIIVQNIYKILPISEVPYLFLFGWLMLRIRGLKWRAIGFKKPESWWKIIVLAIVVAFIYQLLSEYLIEPSINYFTQQPADLSDFKDLPGNTVLMLIYLVAIWILAAFGEEFVYRGYIMHRVADVGNRTNAAWIVSVILVSVLFGIGHFYQGTAGMIGSGFSSLLIAIIFFYTGRNIWVLILIHGFSDTIGLLMIYSGWYQI